MASVTGSSEDESVVDSDEEGSEEFSGEEDLEDEEEGLSWDELEKEAARYATEPLHLLIHLYNFFLCPFYSQDPKCIALLISLPCTSCRFTVSLVASQVDKLPLDFQLISLCFFERFVIENKS